MPLSFVLGINVALRAPLIVGGVPVARPRRVARAWRWARSTSSRCRRRTARRGTRWRPRPPPACGSIRASHVLLFLTLALFLAGGASEAYDRYIEKYLLGLDQPGWPGWSALTWLAVVGWLSAALGIVVPWWFERRHAQLPANRQQQWIVGLIAAQVVALLVLAMTGSFLLAAARQPASSTGSARCARACSASWIVPLTPKDRRATVLSTMEQADSISQVTIGPAMGVIGQAAGIPAALATSAGAAGAVRARRAPRRREPM